MTYETDCTCGKVLEVHAADAGATLRCACGRDVDVPPLSRLRRLDPPPRRPAPPPVDLAFLRVPGVITTLAGVGFGCVSGIALAGVDSDTNVLRAFISLAVLTAQIVGVALVCVSKRFPIFLCILLPPLACIGLVVAMLIPERLPPEPLPPG